MLQLSSGRAARIATLFFALTCCAVAQYSDWHPVGNSKGLTWRWRSQAGTVQTCVIEIREGEKLRSTTAHIKIEYSFENRRNKKDHTVSYQGSDSAVFHLDSCQQVDIVVADRVRRN